MFENTIFTQDISQFTEKTDTVVKFEEFISSIDTKEKAEEFPNITLLGDPAFIYRGVEYLRLNKLKYNFFDKVHSSSISEDLTTMYFNPGYINLELISFLRSAKNGYLIVMGAQMREIIKDMEGFELKRKSYHKEREEMDVLKEKLEKLKKRLKAEKKRLKEEELETSEDLEDYEERIEFLSGKILRKKDILKTSKVTNASFLIEHLLNMGVYNLIRGFEPIFLRDDVAILKVSSRLTQGVTSEVVENFLKVRRDSLKEELTNLDMVKEYLYSSNVDFIFKVPERASDLFLLKEIKEIEKQEIMSNIYMTDSKPVAPIKPHIVASLLASGTAGSLDKEVTVNSNEPAAIKSVMLQDEQVEKVFINGQQVVEKVTTWKPQLGVFNKLRKEVVIYKD